MQDAKIHIIVATVYWHAYRFSSDTDIDSVNGRQRRMDQISDLLENKTIMYEVN